MAITNGHIARLYAGAHFINLSFCGYTGNCEVKQTDNKIKKENKASITVKAYSDFLRSSKNS